MHFNQKFWVKLKNYIKIRNSVFIKGTQLRSNVEDVK